MIAKSVNKHKMLLQLIILNLFLPRNGLGENDTDILDDRLVPSSSEFYSSYFFSVEFTKLSFCDLSSAKLALPNPLT